MCTQCQGPRWCNGFPPHQSLLRCHEKLACLAIAAPNYGTPDRYSPATAIYRAFETPTRPPQASRGSLGHLILHTRIVLAEGLYFLHPHQYPCPAPAVVFPLSPTPARNAALVVSSPRRLGGEGVHHVSHSGLRLPTGGHEIGVRIACPCAETIQIPIQDN